MQRLNFVAVFFVVISVVFLFYSLRYYSLDDVFRIMGDQVLIGDTEGGDTMTIKAFRAGPSKATELLAKPKLNVRLFGYTLPERLRELRDAIALKSTF